MTNREPDQESEAERSPAVLALVAILCVVVCILLLMLPPGSLLVDAVYGGF